MEIVSIQEPLGIKYHGVHFKSLDRGDDEPRVKYGGFSVTDNDVGILGSSKMVRSKPSAVGTGDNIRPGAENRLRSVWWGRKYVALVMAVLITASALGAGLGLGLNLHPHALQGSSALSEDAAASVCRGKVCNQILSAVTMSDQLHVFAIGNDTAMWTRVFDGSTWTGDWASLGGSFASQPSTIVWAKGSRMNVFGIDSATSQVVTKDYQDGKWADSWLLMNRSGSTAIAGCNVVQENDRADVFTRSMSTRANIVHNWWVDAVNKWRGQDYPWDPTSGGTSKSTPAIVCRDDPTYHDLVIYDQASGSVMHDQWSKNYMAWLGWNNRGGSFAGNPVLVSPSNSRVDFFGTGTDSQIYHFSWDTKSGYSQLETLGGNFSSMPSVVVTTPERLDVVAVGTDDMLKHRALIGSTWTASWEDLGVFANSAPMAIACGDQAKRRVGVFIIGKKNEAMYASWSASNSSSWKGLARFGSIGGNLTTKWMWEVY